MAKSEDKQKEIEKLALQAQKGDSAAFGKLYDIFAESIYRYVFFRVSNEQDAADLTETVFLKAWENLHQYRAVRLRRTQAHTNSSPTNSFSAWIFRIAHNLVIDHYRLGKQIEELTEDYMDERVGHHPIEKAEQALSSDNLKRALTGLKENYRQIIVLKYINDLSNEEIADVLKKNEGSVRILQFRALKALKKILEEMGVTGF
ncbi:RNA polymerase sigma factor [Candidatus Peregrinibacteria bacterium]|nr:RNA polymerase sigma factor [Candidatus Peregrinibacteria bacterium]